MSRYIPPPLPHLRRLETAAASNPTVARVTLGLFDSILGSRDAALLPDYDPALSDIETLSARCRISARAVFAWGAQRKIVLNELIRARSNVAAALNRMRRQSPFGRRRLRIANALLAKHPPLKPDFQQSPKNQQHVDVLGDDVGRPIGHGTMRRVSALLPNRIEIRRHRDPFYSISADRTAHIRLRADGYSIAEITMAVSIDPPPPALLINGVLEDFFETGTEGVVSSVYDDDERGYDGLHPIHEGDHLTILDQFGRRVWAGTSRCDRKSGWRRYPANPQYGQPCALGHWIHWTQKGFKPDDWARFLVRPKHERLRAVLRKRKSGAEAKL